MRITDVDFYDDIESLPIWRKQEASNYALMANFCSPTIEGINDRFAQMDAHLGRAYQFIEANNNEAAMEAVQEMYKARVNLSHAFNENFLKTDYTALIGTCYIKSVKGEKAKIESKEDFDQYTKILEQLPTKELEQKLSEVKKKLKLN